MPQVIRIGSEILAADTDGIISIPGFDKDLEVLVNVNDHNSGDIPSKTTLITNIMANDGNGKVSKTDTESVVIKTPDNATPIDNSPDTPSPTPTPANTPAPSDSSDSPVTGTKPDPSTPDDNKPAPKPADTQSPGDTKNPEPDNASPGDNDNAKPKDKDTESPPGDDEPKVSSDSAAASEATAD